MADKFLLLFFQLNKTGITIGTAIAKVHQIKQKNLQFICKNWYAQLSLKVERHKVHF